MTQIVPLKDAQLEWDRYLARPDVIKRFEAALPSVGITAQRFTRMVMTAFTMNPALYKCSRDSILRCLIFAAQSGLAPTGRGGLWIVPFGNEATPIVDYRGAATLARRSGKIVEFATGVVYPGDDFDYGKGSDSFLKHKSKLTTEPRKDEDIVGVYAYAKLTEGGFEFEVLSKSDVDRYRLKSRAKNSGPWVTDYAAMARKTAALRLCNLLPMQPDDQRLLELAMREQEGIPIDMAKEVDVSDLPSVEATVSDVPPEPAKAAETPAKKTNKADDEFLAGLGD